MIKQMDRKVFGEIVKYELKKLMANKITIITLIICIGLLSGISLTEYIFISPEDRFIATREAELEGKAIDEDMIEKVVEEANSAGGLTAIPGDNVYSHIASYMHRALGAYMRLGENSGEYVLSEVTEEQFYRTRENILEHLYDYFHLSDAEKGYWDSMEAKIPKPFVWKTNYSLYSMRSNSSASITLAILMIGICLSGMFAGELNCRTEDLILCSKNGKGMIASAKLIAGGLFTTAVGVVLFIAVNAPHVIFNGLNGWDTACQLIVPFSSYPYTSGKMVLVCFGVYMLALLLTGSLVMLLSCVIKNMVGTAGVVCAAVFVDMFFSIPPQFRALAQARYLTPVQVLINSSMTDPRLVHVGGVFLTAFQSAAIVYVVLTCIFCMLTFLSYKKARR